MEFKARVYEKGDEKGLVELLSKIFNGWPGFDIKCDATDHWIWKYIDNPTGKSRVVLVESEGMMLGCHHRAYHNLKIGDEVVLCAQAMDLGTHPDYRKMGVNRAIGNLNKEYNQSGRNPSTITFWATTNPIVIAQNKKGGSPSFPHPISYLVRVKDVDLQLDKMGNENRLVNKLGYEVLRNVSKIRGLLKQHDVSGIEINTISYFDETINNFWDKIKHHYDFIYEHSPEYLNWRYFDSRGGNYLVKTASENGDIIGYIVNRINKKSLEYPEGFIVELITLPGRLDVLDALIKDSLTYFDENNVNIVHCWIVQGDSYEGVLLSNEFVKSRQEIGLNYNMQKQNENVEKYRNATPDRLHFTYGSTDWI